MPHLDARRRARVRRSRPHGAWGLAGCLRAAALRARDGGGGFRGQTTPPERGLGRFGKFGDWECGGGEFCASEWAGESGEERGRQEGNDEVGSNLCAASQMPSSATRSLAGSVQSGCRRYVKAFGDIPRPSKARVTLVS